MSYRDLIREAWVFTQSHKKLIYWFGFLPAIFTTTAGLLILSYQFFSFKKSPLFDNAKHSFLSDVVNWVYQFFTKNMDIAVPLLIVVAVLLIIYLLLPTLARAAAIQYIARKRNGHPTSIGDGFKYGLLRFLPLFEYHLMIKTFGLFSIAFEAAFVLRNYGVEWFKFLLPIFIIFSVIGLFLTLLFTYADFFIVVDNDEIFPAIRKSIKLVVLHWQKTFLVTLLMMIIGIRIVLQVILLLLIPALILFIGGYIATLALAKIGFIIGIILGLIALFFASYLSGVVDVFSYAVWTFTFMNLTEEKEVSAREVVSS